MILLFASTVKYLFPAENISSLPLESNTWNRFEIKGIGGETFRNVKEEIEEGDLDGDLINCQGLYRVLRSNHKQIALRCVRRN